MEMYNRKHALTNKHSADQSLRNTQLCPIGLRKLTTHVCQYTTTGTQLSEQNNTNIGPCRLTVSLHEFTADTKHVLTL
jgi:hypothetical protein